MTGRSRFVKRTYSSARAWQPWAAFRATWLICEGGSSCCRCAASSVRRTGCMTGPAPSLPSPRRAEFTRYDDREQQSPLDSRRQEAYRRAMQGYLCRCGVYSRIVEAVRMVASA